METIGYMIEQRLKARALGQSTAITLVTHLDEDTICAFVEGRLGQAESSPIISHLVACSSCRGTTAQLIRLESQTTEEPEAGMIQDDTSSRLHSFFENLAVRFTPSSEEDVVFAYQSPEHIADQEIEEPSESTPAATSRSEIDAEPHAAEDQETDK